MDKYCDQCGNKLSSKSVYCSKCGRKVVEGIDNNLNAKSKLGAGLLAIFVGSLGIHNFYLGYNNKAIAQILLTTIGWIFFGVGPIAAAIWALIEGIEILTGYISTDADGIKLIVSVKSFGGES